MPSKRNYQIYRCLKFDPTNFAACLRPFPCNFSSVMNIKHLIYNKWLLNTLHHEKISVAPFNVITKKNA